MVYQGVLTVSRNLATFISQDAELIGGLRVTEGWDSFDWLSLRYGRGTASFTVDIELYNHAPFFVALGIFDTSGGLAID